MASSPSAAQLTEGHRLAQARIGAQTVRLMRSSWALLDPTDLDGTMGRWLRVTVPLVQRQRRQSILLAGSYLQAFRAVELGMDARYVPVLDVPDELQAIITSLTVTGPVSIKDRCSGFVPSKPPRRPRRPVRLPPRCATPSTVAASHERSVRADKRALDGSGRRREAWRFCAMLASPRTVYGEASGPSKPRTTAFTPRSRVPRGHGLAGGFRPVPGPLAAGQGRRRRHVRGLPAARRSRLTERHPGGGPISPRRARDRPEP